MGKHFGELATIRGIIYYKLSQHEQRAFGGMISKGVPNTFRRIRDSFFTIVPPFVLSYMIYEAGEREHHRLGRKNPQDYINDK